MHSVLVNGDTVELHVTSVAFQHSKFVVVKAQFDKIKVSFKIYLSTSMQLFGFKDTGRASAEVYASSLVSYLTQSLQTRGLGITADAAEVLAVSAFHVGVSECGYRFDVDALEAVLRSSVGAARITRNSRNNSVVIRHGPTSGSQIFHATGTMQLMGVRTSTEEYLAATRVLLAGNSHVLVAQDKKRKRRKGMITGDAFSASAKTTRSESDHHTSSAVAALHEQRITDATTSVDSVLDDLLVDNTLVDELHSVLSTENGTDHDAESNASKLETLDDQSEYAKGEAWLGMDGGNGMDDMSDLLSL
mmetsp:Transcript_35424/g.82458  ORF Transcript_35424/g.82458 Transcript_35424/m.82458 type:complete len:304 (+) Transcript_35424:280-1191(+)